MMLANRYLGATVTFLVLFCLPRFGHAFEGSVGERERNFDSYDVVHHRPFELEACRGKWVFLDFSTSWCTPCMEELPKLIEAAQPYIDADQLQFVLVMGDDKATTPQMVATLQKLHANFTVLNEPIGPDMEAFQEWKIWEQGIPRSYLIDPQGVIVAKDVRSDVVPMVFNYFLGTQRPVVALTGSAIQQEDGSYSVFALLTNPRHTKVPVKLSLIWTAYKLDEQNVILDSSQDYLEVGSQTSLTDELGESVIEFPLSIDPSWGSFTYTLSLPYPDDELGSTYKLQYHSPEIELKKVEYVDGKNRVVE